MWVRMRTTGRKTLSVRTDGRTVVLGRVRSSKKRLASSRPTTRGTCHRPVAIAVHIVPYDDRLDRAFTNSLRPVVRMRTTQVPHPQASTPRDVSDQAFPELSNVLRVTLHACGGRPGNEATLDLRTPPKIL